MKVVYLARDDEGPGSYRILYPLQALADTGEIEIEPFPSTIEKHGDGSHTTIIDVTVERVPLADLYIIQQPLDREFIIDTPGAKAVIPELQKRAPVIVELDDNFLQVPVGNQAFQGTHPNWRIQLRQWAEREGKTRVTRQDILHFAAKAQVTNRNNLNQAIHMADALQVSTPFLQKLYQRPHVYCLRNWLRKADWANSQPYQGRQFTVGYTGVAKWKRDDMRLLTGLLGPWMERHDDVRFFAAGDPSTIEILQLNPAKCDFQPRATFPGHVPMYGLMHLGLVPLQRNNFNQAKSWLTGMELNAAHVPAVASPLDSYHHYADAGGTVVLADRANNWIHHLNQAKKFFDLNGWQHWQQTARSAAEKFWLEDHLDVWLAVYKEVCQRHARERMRQTKTKASSSRPTSPPPSPKASAPSLPA